MGNKYIRYFAIFFLPIIIIAFISFYKFLKASKKKPTSPSTVEITWQAPDIRLLPATAETEMIRYGRELIANTAGYLGPKGSVAQISNGMNCQNCHLEAGTRPYGNCFATVATSYPKYRDRSGQIESIEFRINECMERSMNGKKLDSLGKEMKAMVAYINWVGKDLHNAVSLNGTGVLELAFLDRAADPARGNIIFNAKCQRCHGANGDGLQKPDSSGYVYPPLWGTKSYNVSAGMYRLTRFAAFVKYNMPFSADHKEPLLTDKEAWDVAAFVNSQQRDEKFFSYDWPKIDTKPVDYPFAPFADSFSATQHKYGPFKEMKIKKTNH